MDFWEAIQQLHHEKERLDKAIEILEAIAEGNSPAPASRRGRKTMPENERKLVSERMKRYWSSRRSENGTTP